MAFLVMDPPVNVAADNLVPGYTVTIAEATADTDFPRSKNAAVYFPYLLTADPVSGSTTNIVTGKPYEIPPAATVAGVFARTDVARGVWKAPAGFQATCSNVSNVTARGQMTDPLQGTLNPTGINCIRVFPNVPPIVFGARTLAVTFDPQWTYVPVRRMALFLEQTFYANLKWVIFEPNAQPLWTAITMTITTFMLGLFNQKALQGDTPSQAFSVQCDGTTTTQADIDQGIVNIVVGFAPLKPAEFVIITIAQLAGQAQTS
jgi:phage tail sheath protein FI